MEEQYKYFISFSVDIMGEQLLFRNKEILHKLIESEEDIREIERSLNQNANEIITIINYRMF